MVDDPRISRDNGTLGLQVFSAELPLLCRRVPAVAALYDSVATHTRSLIDDKVSDKFDRGHTDFGGKTAQMEDLIRQSSDQLCSVNT